MQRLRRVREGQEEGLVEIHVGGSARFGSDRNYNYVISFSIRTATYVPYNRSLQCSGTLHSHSTGPICLTRDQLLARDQWSTA